jgi:hypothetical protein
MSSLYGIVKADLVPGLISETEYARCLANPGGTVSAVIGDVVTQAEGELHAAAGGAPSGASVQALFKPMAIACLLYRLHARRAQQDNAKIPDTVAADRRAALDWAADQGRTLIDGEKAAAGLDGSGAASTFPDASSNTPEMTRDKLQGF